MACTALFAWAFAVFCHAQPVKALNHLVLRTWNTDQGLPQDFITAIEQTPDGFLWIGTNNGLARFDGLRFRTFERDGPPAIRRNITSLAVDTQGTLWVGTSQGLFSYYNAAFHSVLLAKSSAESVLQVFAARGGCCVWIRTRSGIYHADPKGVRQIPLSIDGNRIADFAVDHEQRLWIADRQSVVAIEDGRTQRFPLPDSILLYVAPDGRVFAGDGHHLFLFTHGRFLQQPKQGPDEFVQIMIDKRGQLWMASGGLQGISRLSDGRVQMLDARSGLASNDARVLFEGRDGDIWIGTVSGLQRLHQGVFISYTEQDGLPAKHAQYDSIFEDRKGAIWVGTLEHGIAALRGDRWERIGDGRGVRRGQVRGFADDGEYPVIAVADYGLFKMSNGKYHKIPGIPAGYVSSPIRASDGSLWFGILHKGVFKLHDGKLSSFGNADGLTDDTIWELAEGRDGVIWAAGLKGAFRYDGHKWRTEYSPPYSVLDVLPAKDGGVFFGTSFGLYYRDASGEKTWGLQEENGLPSNSVFAVLEDDNRDVWMSTARGICRIPRGEFDHFLRDKAAGVTAEVFTADDGLKSRSSLPMAGVTALRAHDGRLWFVTASAPAVTTPALAESPTPQAVVDQVAVDDVPAPQGSIRIPPGRHRVVFSFTAPVFTAPEQVSFRYRLSGWDNGWVPAGSPGNVIRDAVYIGLPPGNYTFEVQALSRTGEAGPISQGLPVHLQPFFWQTRMFLIVAGLTAIAIVVETTRRRTLHRAERLNMRFQERAAERERIASEIHDTLIQELTGTALQMELAEMQLEDDPSATRRLLGQLGTRMRDMIARSRDMVSNLHSMAVPDSSLLELLRHVESEFRIGELPQYLLTSEGNVYSLHPLLRDELYRVCREAVANAFRHAQANEIAVHVLFGEKTITVDVRDDGIGMSDETRTRGRVGHFGLAGMQMHAQRIGAVLDLRSAPGSGTCLSIRAPLPKARVKLLRQAFRRSTEPNVKLPESQGGSQHEIL